LVSWSVGQLERKKLREKGKSLNVAEGLGYEALSES